MSESNCLFLAAIGALPERQYPSLPPKDFLIASKTGLFSLMSVISPFYPPNFAIIPSKILL